MKTEFFIARRLIKDKNTTKKVSKPIVRISMISIVLGMAVMIVTVSAVLGFQNEVKGKVIGFGSHIQIMNAGEYSPYESTPMLKKQPFYPSIKEKDGVKHIQYFAYKPAILQSEKDSVKYSFQGKDTFEIKQEIKGAIVKGIGEDYDWSFFQSKLIEGVLPDYTQDKASKEIIVSASIAKQMNYKLNDEIDVFFIQDRPKKRKLTIVGIYKTGLEEFDRELILGDLKQIQRMNNWGINASYVIEDTVDLGYLRFRVDAIGGTGYYKYDFGFGYQNKGYGYINPNKDTTLRITVSDYARIKGRDSILSVPDTIWLSIKVEGNGFANCQPRKKDGFVPEREYLDDLGFHYKILLEEKNVEIKTKVSGKSSQEYVGGFEVILNDWSDLDRVDQIADDYIVIPSLQAGKPLRVETIKKIHRDIFDWLNFLDVLTYIIIIMMVLVSIINMGSTLLVLILEKTNMIGIMKSYGTTNRSMRKIFLFQAMFIVLKGMFWGNVVGVAIVMIQYYTHIIPLNPEVYFMDHVAMDLNIWSILLLNIGTLIVCVVAMMIPVLFVSNVKPVKAIKFD